MDTASGHGGGKQSCTGGGGGGGGGERGPPSLRTPLRQSFWARTRAPSASIASMAALSSLMRTKK
eukprot:4099797-Pyramimonas_sp.AAC.1